MSHLWGCIGMNGLIRWTRTNQVNSRNSFAMMIQYKNKHYPDYYHYYLLLLILTSEDLRTCGSTCVWWFLCRWWRRVRPPVSHWVPVRTGSQRRETHRRNYSPTNTRVTWHMSRDREPVVTSLSVATFRSNELQAAELWLPVAVVMFACVGTSVKKS